MADVPPHAAHVPRMLLERIARDPESVGRPHTFTIDAAVVAVDICGYVPMTDWAMRGVLRRERSVKRPHSLRASFSSSSSFDAFEGGDPDNADDDAADLLCDPGDEHEGRRSSDASGSDLCLGVAGLTGEEARNVVTACFTKAIREIHERGGDVLKFAGDALFAAWTASDDVSLGTCVAHAARCASAIHATVSKVGDPNTDNSSSVRLKVCVGAGELHAFNVGGVGGKWEFMCAGEPLAQIAKLMPLANPGQTLVSERAHSIIQSQSTGAHLRTAPAATGGHRLVIDRPRTDDSDGIEHDIEHDIEDMIPPTSTPEAIVRLHAPNNASSTKLAEWRRAVAAATAGYVPHPAADGVADTTHHWLGEIRRCSVAFVCFEGVNYERPDALPRLQRAATTMQRALRRAAGASRQMLVDEKGSALVAVFGLDGGRSNRSATCACDATLAAMEMRRELRGAGLGTKCGVSTGDAFCGMVGVVDRCEWAVYGDVANLAARLCHHEMNPGVLVCDATRRTCVEAAARPNNSGRIGVDFAGPFHFKLKGKNREARAYEPRVKSPSNPNPKVTSSGLRRTGSLAAELDTLRRRIDAMPSGARRLVKVAAVVGGSIDLTLLARVANNADLDVEDGVRKLTASGVLVHGDTGDMTSVEFADELMRKVAYSTLTDAARRPLHQAVATAREKQLFGVAMKSNSRGFDSSAPCVVGPEDACELAYHWNRAGRVSRGDDYLAMAESWAGGESSYGIDEHESDLSEVTVTLSLAADKEDVETTATRAGCFAGLFR